ncbi:MAG: hypothetical protein HYT13_01990 [Candidatus Liptonbacteria bacterium]|nr:hypothetical protein [Candidatus Liptonbacteria bacterium]
MKPVNVVYRGSLLHATQLLARFEEGRCLTGGFKKFLTTIEVRFPNEVRFAEFDGEFELPEEFMNSLQEQGLQGELEKYLCPSLHIRTPWRSDQKKEVVMWLTGLPYHKINGGSFRKVVQSFANLIISTSAGVQVRTPTLSEQSEYEIHAPQWIVKAKHPTLHFNPLPNFLHSSFRASRKYSLIDAERQLDVTFRLNTPERIKAGGSESVIRVSEVVSRGHGYDLAIDLVRGCPDADVFYRSYNESTLWQKLSETARRKELCRKIAEPYFEKYGLKPDCSYCVHFEGMVQTLHSHGVTNPTLLTILALILAEELVGQIGMVQRSGERAEQVIDQALSLKIWREEDLPQKGSAGEVILRGVLLQLYENWQDKERVVYIHSSFASGKYEKVLV